MGFLDHLDLPSLTDQGKCAKAKGEQPSRHEVKVGRRAEQLAQWKAVCKLVDRRDGRRCRACGHGANSDAVGLLERAHRHHVEFRSAGGKDETWNVVTLCAACHHEVHVKRTLRIEMASPDGAGADGALLFWRIDEAGAEYLSRRETAPHRVERD